MFFNTLDFFLKLTVPLPRISFFPTTALDGRQAILAVSVVYGGRGDDVQRGGLGCGGWGMMNSISVFFFLI